MEKVITGWALLSGKKLRAYGFTDALGMIASQSAIWPTKRLAKDMAILGESPRKVRITYSFGQPKGGK